MLIKEHSHIAAIADSALLQIKVVLSYSFNADMNHIMHFNILNADRSTIIQLFENCHILLHTLNHLENTAPSVLIKLREYYRLTMVSNNDKVIKNKKDRLTFYTQYHDFVTVLYILYLDDHLFGLSSTVFSYYILQKILWASFKGKTRK